MTTTRAIVAWRGRVAAAVVSVSVALPLGPASAQSAVAAIERVKPSIVAVGTFERTRTPAFEFRGTGFAVGDGTLIATNAHVLPKRIDGPRLEVLGILVPVPGGTQVQFREAKQVAIDPGSDLALLQIGGNALPALPLADSDAVKEGQGVLFTGYPIGNALGPFPATHRGMVAAVSPIAIPQARSGDLDPKVIRRLSVGAFPIFQLDAVAYPGNSGSPVYDPETGQVLGVINMVFVKGTKESVLTQPSGITYAVPSNHLRALLQAPR